MRGPGALLFLVLGLAPFSSIPKEFRVDGLDLSLGERETLLGHKTLGLSYFPDTATTVLERKPEIKILITAGVATYEVAGKNPRELSRVRKVLEPGLAGAFDNGYAGISGIFRMDDKNLYALYHAEDQESMPEVGPGVPGFYAEVGLARSSDGGRSFTKLGAVVQSHQKKTAGGTPDQGCGELCLTPDASGQYLYCYYVDHSRIEDRGVQIFLARANIKEGAPLPGTWKKWRKGSFSEPGLGGLDSPVVSAMDGGADAIFPQVTWIPRLGRYLMLYNINAWREYAGLAEPGPPQRSGIYAATSVDGLNWSKPVLLISAFSVAVAYREVAWHPSLLLDVENGLEGWLVYAWTPKWQHEPLGGVPHYLVGHRIRIVPDP